MPIGTGLYINVIANFENGESINETKCVTVHNNVIWEATIQFRGNLKDFESSIINYQVMIYH